MVLAAVDRRDRVDAWKWVEQLLDVTQDPDPEDPWSTMANHLGRRVGCWAAFDEPGDEVEMMLAVKAFRLVDGIRIMRGD